MRKILSTTLILLIIFILSAGSAYAGSADDQRIIEEIIQSRQNEAGVLSLQDLVTDVFANSPASGEDWYILSFRNYAKDIYYGDYVEALENYFINNKISNPATKERLALTLISLGSTIKELDNVVDECAEGLGIMSLTFALHLLNNHAASKNYSKQKVLDLILDKMLQNGGWSLSGETADIDVTSMVLQAIAPYKNEEKIKNAIDIALDILSSRQNGDGGYISFGNNNPESPSQVIMALAHLGIDAKQDERFIKNGHTLFDAISNFRLEDGSYCHIINNKSNKNSTAQVLYAYVGYTRFIEGKTPFYEFSELQIVPKPPAKGKQTEEKELPIKTIISIAAAAIAACACIIALIRKKPKSIITIAAIAAIVIAGVNLLKIENNTQHFDPEKNKPKEYITTTLSIRCDVLNNNEKAQSSENVPKDGIIVDFITIDVEKGQSAYDQLMSAAKTCKLHTDVESVSSYVRGINNIYEFDYGNLSGWMFRVNGNYGGTSSIEYILEDGDYIEWIYTLELGKDIGNDYSGK